MSKNVLFQISLAIDQLANTLAGGYADETISSRCYRNAKLSPKPKKRWVFMFKLVNTLFMDKEHCKTAYESEVKRRQLPPEFQDLS